MEFSVAKAKLVNL